MNDKINDKKNNKDYKKNASIAASVAIGVVALFFAIKNDDPEGVQKAAEKIADGIEEYGYYDDSDTDQSIEFNKDKDSKKDSTSKIESAKVSKSDRLDINNNAETKPKNCPVVGPNASGGINAMPGCYDIYVLSQFWGNSFCVELDRKSRKCNKTLSEGQYGHDGVILHGLWPNYNYNARGGTVYPQNCSRVPLELNKFNNNDREALLKVYANSMHLIEHEWNKHGTCTKYTPTDYYKLAIKVHNALPLPSAIVKQIGKTLSYEDIARAYGGKSKVQLICNRDKNSQRLSEIRFTFSRDMKLMDINHPVNGTCSTQQPIYLAPLKRNN